VNRLFKYVGIGTVVIAACWFVVSCGTSLSGDQCGSNKMEPGDVCVSSHGGSSTYEEKMAAKEAAPRHMQSAGALFVAGLVLVIVCNVIDLRSDRA